MITNTHLNDCKTGFEVNLWNGEGFNEIQTLQTSSPTGRALLEVFNQVPPDEHILIELSKNGGLREIQIDEEIDLKDEIKKFFTFRNDRTYNFSLNDKRYTWGNSTISEIILRMVGHINNSDELLLELTDKPDKILDPSELVDLTSSKVEHISSRKKEWKLNVQGVILCLSTYEIIVSDALIQAGFDPNEGWTAILKIKGKPKKPVELDSIIDLREPGIEKLRLRPNEIKNGEAINILRKDFCLLDKDEAYLNNRKMVWETFIEGGKRLLVIRTFKIPAGYNAVSVDIIMDIPNTYPAAAMDMFYCSPILKLSNGSLPVRADTYQQIEEIQYQRWSRHLSGATRWNPKTDSVISHIAFIEASIENEVGE